MRRKTLLFMTFAMIVTYWIPAKCTEASGDPLQQGIQAFKAGDFRKAENLLSVATTQAPSALNFNYLAMTEWSLGKMNAAIADFRQSIELGNRSALVHYNLGLAYLKQNEMSEGIGELKRAADMDLKLKSAQYALAVALIDAHRPGEAIPYLMALKKQSPCDAAVLANLVRAQFTSGDTHSALLTVAEATHATPTNVRLFVTLASLCATYHQVQTARNLLEDASELKPEDPEIKLLLAKVSLEAKEPVEALAVLKSMPPNCAAPGEIPYIKGVAMALGGKSKAAITEFSSAVGAQPRNVSYLIGEAWAYQLEGQHSKALSILEKAQELEPRTPIIPYRMAVSYFFLHLYPQAAADCEETIRRAPQYPSAYLLLGATRLEEHELDPAVDALQRAVDISPKTALYQRELGVALFKQDKLTESHKALDLALKLDSKAPQAYYWRARVLEKQGQRSGAIADLETSVAIQPSFSEAYFTLAKLYSASGQIKKATAMLAKAKQLEAIQNPNDRDRYLLSEIADPL